jgi:hypothetical protein
MSAETLTYAAITDRLGFSSALRTFVNRLPWQSTNNGISLAASTARPPVDDQSVVATLTARIIRQGRCRRSSGGLRARAVRTTHGRST